MCCSPLLDWTGSALLFHSTPRKMVFPWVVACNQVHVFSWPLISAVKLSQRDQWSSVREELDLHQSLLAVSGSEGGAENRVQCCCSRISRGIRRTPLLTMAVLRLCVVMRLRVADGRKVCISHWQYTVITSLKPSSVFVSSACSFLSDLACCNYFYSTAFIFVNREQKDEPGGWVSSRHIQLNNVNLQPNIIARCWICFRRPLCTFLSSSAVNHNERA